MFTRKCVIPCCVPRVGTPVGGGSGYLWSQINHLTIAHHWPKGFALEMPHLLGNHPPFFSPVSPSGDEVERPVHAWSYRGTCLGSHQTLSHRTSGWDVLWGRCWKRCRDVWGEWGCGLQRARELWGAEGGMRQAQRSPRPGPV